MPPLKWGQISSGIRPVSRIDLCAGLVASRQTLVLRSPAKVLATMRIRVEVMTRCRAGGRQ
jgi:hypothetical protein